MKEFNNTQYYIDSLEMIIGLLYEIKRDNIQNIFKINHYKSLLTKIQSCNEIDGTLNFDKLKEMELTENDHAIIDEIKTKGSAKSKIEEYAKKNKKVIRNSSQKISAIVNLMQIKGIGYELARRYHNVLGIKNIKDLLSSDQVPERIKWAAKLHENLKKRIPRNIVEKIFSKIELDNEMIICGSYRRGASDSGDIDILVKTIATSLEIEQFIKECIEIKQKIMNQLKDIIITIWSDGPTKFSYIIKSSARYMFLEFYIAPPDQFVSALLQLTGPVDFNIRMRHIAKELGYRLSEKGIKNRYK